MCNCPGPTTKRMKNAMIILIWEYPNLRGIMHTFNKIKKEVSTGGIDWKKSSAKYFKLLVSNKLATTCGWSNSVHFTHGNASDNILQTFLCHLLHQPVNPIFQRFAYNISKPSLLWPFVYHWPLLGWNCCQIQDFVPFNPINRFH